MKGIDRYWFLTWTMYGQWLPGDPRGSVTRIELPGQSHREEQDEFGTPRTEAIPDLNESARKRLKCDPIYLTLEHAEKLLPQFQETAAIRKWLLVGTAIMANHIHVVVGVPDDPDPEDLLRDLKAYGSRKLNREFGKPKSETWWTQSGSKRKLPDRVAIQNAVQYLRDQEFPLVIWINPIVDTW
jgi:REP element-mobilizing transposase RayT